MDNAGTLPIYVYNNTQAEDFLALPMVIGPEPQVAVNEHPDDLEYATQTETITRSGRKTKKRKNNDTHYY